MSQLHFQPIRGMELDIIDTILRTEEVAAAEGCRGVIRLVAEELVVNIADYAGSDYLDVETTLDGESISLCFRDGGTPFNLLDMESPDTSLSLDEREIGGLGVFLVVRHMDKVEYEYKDGENVLTVSKRLK